MAAGWGPACCLVLPSQQHPPTRQQRCTDQSPRRGGRVKEEGAKEGGKKRIQHVAGDNMQRSVGETPFLPLLLLTHPWHSRNVQIKETSKVKMREGIAADIGRTEKLLCLHCGKKEKKQHWHYSQHYVMSVKCNVKKKAQSFPAPW